MTHDEVFLELDTGGGQEILQVDVDVGLIWIFVHSESENGFDPLFFGGQLHVGFGSCGSHIDPDIGGKSTVASSQLDTEFTP